LETTLIPDSVFRALDRFKSRNNYAKTSEQERVYKDLTGNYLRRAGSYSFVIDHKHKDKVTKITMSTVDGYHKYVKWVMAVRPILPPLMRRHLPRIYETIEYKGHRITVMERLIHSYKLEVSEDSPSFKGVRRVVESTTGLFNLNNDLGGANVMYREKTGVAVITDPWSHRIS
jgi:hypothetical protein